MSSPSARSSFRLLMVLAIVLTPAAGHAATTIGQLTDPVQPSVQASLDILSAQVEQTGGQLTFAIQARGAIPGSLPDPDDTLTYLWFVDTDESGSTGQPHGSLGSEFNVRAVVGETYGGGFVDVTGSVPGGGSGTVVIEGSEIRITIWLSQIGGEADFDWCCATFGITNGAYVPGNPDTAITYSETLPYTPPARVTVTTPILELCPTGPATGQLEVVIRDAAGGILLNDEHVITYHSTNEAFGTVDATGLVTAITPPVYHWQTPYIEVWADGVMADNSAVIRINSIDVDVEHSEYPAPHVTFFVPPLLEGVDLGAITTNFEVVEATERAYGAQAAGVGTVPTGGGMEYFVVDVANDPNTSVCGASGNPIRLGWTYGVPANNSCYIVNDPGNRVPQWFVLWHELGHNFTCACNSFNLFCMGPSDPHNSAYCEGLASMAAMWSWHCIMADPQGLGAIALSNLDQHFIAYADGWRQSLRDYENAGSNYDTIDANIVDGILLEMHDDFGLGAWFDLLSTFLPAEAPLPVTIDTREKQATWFVAAMCVSAGEDLRNRFETEYGFPIDYAAWDEILGVVQQRIAARSWVPVEVREDAVPARGRDRLLGNAPNPFETVTAIRFVTAAEGPTTLTVHDLSGRVIARPFDGHLPVGWHAVTWDGRGEDGRRVASGAYMARLATSVGASERKLIVIR